MAESQDDSVSANQNYTMQMKEFPDKDDNSQLKIKSPKSSLAVPDADSMHNSANKSDYKETKPLVSKDDKDDKEKDGKEKEEDDELFYYLEERSKKLRNSKDHNKGIVILQIMSFGLILTGYFIYDYIYEEGFMKNFKKGLEHLKIISERVSNIKYTTVFSLEELAEDDLSVVYPDSNF